MLEAQRTRTRILFLQRTLVLAHTRRRPLLNGSKTERYPCARQHLLDLMKSHSHLLDVALPVRRTRQMQAHAGFPCCA